jgi:predicted PurR-regulated permease PerM
MSDRWSQPMIRTVQGIVCVVIIMWGMRIASHLIVLLAMALLLAYAFVPLPQWLMRRFRLGRTAALLLTVALLGTFNVVSVTLLYDSVIRFREKLPVYHEHFLILVDKTTSFARAHGVDVASLPFARVPASDHMVQIAREALRQAGGFLGDGLLISILTWIFLIEMVDKAGAKKGPLAEKLSYYGEDVQRYIAISAKTGLTTALANLLVLVALGVDFPLLWCALYFFLHFIPNVGFIFALVPPTLLALLMLGWKTALLVGGALIVTQLLTDYGLTPILMKKGVRISFLEIMVSLMVWGFLLGPAGDILAIPLTLTLKKVFEGLLAKEDLEGRAVAVTSAEPAVVEGSVLARAV